MDGNHGRSYVNRGTLTLHSLYLLLWANFGSFCIALLTQPDAYENIRGHVISSWQPLRRYCLSQLRTVWMHICNNMDLSLEQRSFFIMEAMAKVQQVL